MLKSDVEMHPRINISPFLKGLEKAAESVRKHTASRELDFAISKISKS